MGSASRAVCPICGSEARRRSDNPAFPFCQPKCKLVDLSKWMDGHYRIMTDERPDHGDTTDGLDANDATKEDF